MQKGKSSISGEITCDVREQDKIFCCTKDCIQALLLTRKQVWLDSWHSCGAVRYPHDGACSRLHCLEQGFTLLSQCQDNLVLGWGVSIDQRWH